MTIQDKIGKELAHDLLVKFEAVHQWDEERLKVFKNVRLYKFFLNDPIAYVKHYKTGVMTPYRKGRDKRDHTTGVIILRFELDKQLEAGVIDKDQYDTLLTMCGNKEDYLIAELTIDQLRNKRKKKARKT